MNAAAAIHAFALAILFAAHFSFAEEFDGVRRALQTMASVETAQTATDAAHARPAPLA